MKNLLLLAALLPCAPISAQNLPNGDFESFGTQAVTLYRIVGNTFDPATCQNTSNTFAFEKTFTSTNRPLGFGTSDDFFELSPPSYVTQETDPAHVYAGTSSVKLTSDGFLSGAVGLFEPEEFVQALVPVAYPFEAVPAAIEGFYKHTSGAPLTFPAGTCTRQGPLTQETTFNGGFAVYARMTRRDAATNQDVVVATAYSVFADVANYTAFSAPVTVLQPGLVPDSIVFALSCTPEFLSPNPIAIGGSVSYVDNVNFRFCAPADTAITVAGSTLTANEASAAGYQWLDCQDNFAPIAGATGQSYTAAASGSYAVAITRNGCPPDTSGCVSVVVTHAAGPAPAAQLRVFPNPARDFVWLQQADGLPLTPITVRVYRANGELIGQYATTRAVPSLRIPLGTPPGLYLVRVTSDAGTEQTMRIIKP